MNCYVQGRALSSRISVPWTNLALASSRITPSATKRELCASKCRKRRWEINPGMFEWVIRLSLRKGMQTGWRRRRSLISGDSRFKAAMISNTTVLDEKNLSISVITVFSRSLIQDFSFTLPLGAYLPYEVIRNCHSAFLGMEGPG